MRYNEVLIVYDIQFLPASTRLVIYWDLINPTLKYQLAVSKTGEYKAFQKWQQLFRLQPMFIQENSYNHLHFICLRSVSFGCLKHNNEKKQCRYDWQERTVFSTFTGMECSTVFASLRKCDFASVSWVYNLFVIVLITKTLKKTQFVLCVRYNIQIDVRHIKTHCITQQFFIIIWRLFTEMSCHSIILFIKNALAYNNRNQRDVLYHN